MRPQTTTLWMVFFGLLFLFTAGLNSLEVLMIDTRFALFVHEMLERGFGPYPQLYGQFYPDYTSIPTGLMALAALVIGKVNQLSLAFPSCVASALMLMLTCLLGMQYRSCRYGLSAVFLALMSFEFLNINRIASIDLYPALAGTISYMLAWQALQQKKQRLQYWILLCIAAGYLARGPIGGVIPTATAIAAFLAWRDYRSCVKIGIGAILVIALLAGAWLYWASKAGGEEFVRNVIAMQVASRMESGKPIWYYFTNAVGSYAIVYPLGLFVLAITLYRQRKNLRSLRAVPAPEERMIQGLAIWMLLILFGMSVPGTKHLRYIVGVIPPAALLAALLFENPQHWRLFSRIRGWFIQVALYFPAGLIAALLLLQFARLKSFEKLARMGEPFDQANSLWAIPLLALILLGYLLLKSKRLSFRNRTTLILAGTALSFVTLHLAILEPFNQATQSSERFVAAAECWRPVEQPIYFFELGPDGDENKYLYNVTRARQFLPLYLNIDQTLPTGTLVVTRVDKWEKLMPETIRSQYETLQTGQLGHRRAALLRKR